MGFQNREVGNFYSGRELEVDVLGKPKFPPAYEAAYRRLAHEKGGYLPYHQAQALIREFNPDDPTNPKQDFARDARLAICDALELDEEDMDSVKFYSAVGTALDIYHGVDGWFEIDCEDLKAGHLHAEVSLDVTKRADKLDEGHKADVMIGDVAAPDDEAYLTAVDKYAGEITRVMIERILAAGERKVLVGAR